MPRDFVEAPSQMLENWVWDKKVLDSFAADYRDPSKKIPADILAKLKEAQLATEGNALSPPALVRPDGHDAAHADPRRATPRKRCRSPTKCSSEVFLPMPPDTAFVAYFGHLMGYDAGYYGYAWADAIAADMATVFEKAPDGYFDKNAGTRLRERSTKPGDSRDVNVSIEKFLGRQRSLEPFLKKIGVNAEAAAKKAN